MENIIPRSFLAGTLIAVSDYIYINADNKIIAAFLFPLALITIIKTSSYLFTGKIGAVEPNILSISSMIAILIGNALGLLPLILSSPLESYKEFFSAKLMTPVNDLLIKSIICGVLMNLAVSFTSNRTDFLLTIMCVAGFLMGKCEHSVADIGYLIISRSFSLEALTFILIVVLGNSIGAVLMNLGVKKLSQ